MNQNPNGPYSSDPNYPSMTDPQNAGTLPSARPLPEMPYQQPGLDPNTPNRPYSNPPSQPQMPGGPYYPPPQRMGPFAEMGGMTQPPNYGVPNQPSLPPFGTGPTGQQQPSGPMYGAPNPQGMPPFMGQQQPSGPMYGVPNQPSLPPFGTAPMGQQQDSGPMYAVPNPPSMPPFPPQSTAPQGPLSGYNMYMQPGVAVPPTSPMPPAQQPKKRVTNRTLVLVAVILLLLIAASIFGVVAYNNNQATIHTAATATAQAHARSTARAQATINAQATTAASATTMASTFPFSNNLVLNDQLSDNSHMAQYGWESGTNCFFINGSYNARDPQPTSYVTCGAQNTNFANFTLQVQMSIQLGGPSALEGVFFRGNESAAQYYIFVVDSQGAYLFAVQNNGNGHNLRVLKEGQASGFTPGFGIVNTLGIVARGEQISVYVNNTQNPIFQYTDGSYTTGQIGFVASADSTGRTVDTYNDIKVWQLT